MHQQKVPAVRGPKYCRILLHAATANLESCTIHDSFVDPPFVPGSPDPKRTAAPLEQESLGWQAQSSCCGGFHCQTTACKGIQRKVGQRTLR